MMSGRAALLVLAGFFDCGGGSSNAGPTGSPVNQGAWQSDRILYADTTRGALLTIRDTGSDRQVLIELDGVACPSISADGGRIMATLLETNELVHVRPSGDNSVFGGVGDGTVGTSTLTEDGLRVLFHEHTGDDSGGCPVSQIVSAITNGTEIETTTPEGLCARWPEIDDDGARISYERGDPSTGDRDICMLDALTLGDAGCLSISELTGPRAWSPGGEMLMGNDFRTWRTQDGVETSDPVAELKQLMPPSGQNDVRSKVEARLSALGIALLPGERAPLSLDWGVDDRIVFDAVTDGPGGAGVHVLIYDLRQDAITHVDGPFATAGIEDGAVTHVCPRWMP